MPAVISLHPSPDKNALTLQNFNLDVSEPFNAIQLATGATSMDRSQAQTGPRGLHVNYTRNDKNRVCCGWWVHGCNWGWGRLSWIYTVLSSGSNPFSPIKCKGESATQTVRSVHHPKPTWIHDASPDKLPIIMSFHWHLLHSPSQKNAVSRARKYL